MDRYAKAHLFQACYIFKEEGGLDKEFEMQRETRVLLSNELISPNISICKTFVKSNKW